MTEFPNLQIWGKTYELGEEKLYYPLLAHMLDTLAASRIIYDTWLSENIRQYLQNQFGNREEALAYISLACGLHDIGKSTPIFQASLLNSRALESHSTQAEKLKQSGLPFPDMRNYSTSTLRDRKLHRHEKLGHWLLSKEEDLTNQKIQQSWITLATLGHHGTFEISYKRGRGRNDSTELKEIITNEWVEEADKLVAQIETASNRTVQDANNKKISNAAAILISGIVVLSDRLASNEQTVKNSHTNSLKHLHNQDTRKYIESQTSYLQKLIPETLGKRANLTNTDVLQAYEPRGVQKFVPSERGLWLVMAPTGSGKTEAALLRHTHHEENLLFLLPTKSTTDAMFSRIAKMYENKTSTVATLAHSDASLNRFYDKKVGFNENHDDEEESCGSGLIPAQLTNAGARLSAPITIATIDQLVMGGLPLKWAPLRLLTIANSHTVIDESHLIDPYQLTLISELLSFLGEVNSNVTLLSATMPHLLKKSIIESYTQKEAPGTETMFPSTEMHYADGNEASSFTALETIEYETLVEVTETSDPTATHTVWAAETFKKSPNARLGIFVNTVQRSQQIASHLKEQHPEATVICLNSRMLGKHKNETVEKLTKMFNSKTGSTNKAIIVGTQIIEMSLDIDLDYISTDLAPAPSIIQRLGRVWRNRSSEATLKRNERTAPTTHETLTIHVAAFTDDEKTKLHLPYPQNQLERTRTHLEELKKITFPGSVQNFINISHSPSTENDIILYSEDTAEETVNTIFQTVKANQVRAKIMDFLNPETTQKEAHQLTKSTLDADTATRLIENSYPNLILISEDPELVRLGAFTTLEEAEKASLKQLKAATIPLNYKLTKLLQEAGNTLTSTKTSQIYITKLPPTIHYDPLTGLQETL